MTHRTRGRQTRPHSGPGQQALLVAATRRGPASVCTPQDAPHQEAIAMGVPVPSRAVASHLTDDRLADREIGFADIPAENPNLLTADPQPADAVRGVEPSPLRAGHEHADAVMRELRAETPKLAAPAPDEHVTHHQVPRGFELRAVPLVDPVAELCDDVELHIARFAIAASDLALKPGGVHALRMLLAPHADRPVTVYDHRPVGVTVGFDLETAVAA